MSTPTLRSGFRITSRVAALLWLATVAAVAAPPEPVEFFENRVRPVLSQSCGKCHGATKQSGGLRLDSRAAILEGGVNGPAITAGNPDDSLLIQAVRKTHEDIKMPPKGVLHTHEIEALADWIKMGAPWPKDIPKAVAATAKGATKADDHWAFRAVRPVTLPDVKDARGIQSPVDRFVHVRLEKAGLTPSPETDRRTLIRRATFDLTGLPPTPQEVDAFVADPRPDAYDRVVDRLLASPRYGERWGRHWLDVARYADTKGYVFQEERRYPYSYTYRDYVIRSFNDDLPYDQFVVEQLAADRLGPGHDAKALAALGYLTLGRRFLNNQADIIDDRIDVVCRGMLGLTVTCARCHDHKYDPIPADDYYSLYGVFASSVEPADPPEIPAAVSDVLNRDFRAQRDAKAKAVATFLDSKRGAIEADLTQNVAAYLKAAFDLGFDGKNAKLDDRAKADKLTPSRLRAVSNRWKQRLDATRGKPDPVFAPWHAFAALAGTEFSRQAPGVAKSLAATDDPKIDNPIVAQSFADNPPATMAEVAARYGALIAETNVLWAASLKADPKAKALKDAARESLRQAVYGNGGPLAINAESLPRLLARDERNTLTSLNKALEQLKATHPGSPPRAMVLNDAPNLVDPHVFLRGNPGRPGKAVPRQFLGVLSGPDRKPFKEGSGRLELARAIASADNPLTARVLVNRVWLNHFGVGLVTSPSDFGRRSDPPIYPDLLDWLATDFTSHGWSIKHLHRRIMRSSTYRQSSDPRSDLAAKDPENRLLGRFNRRRLDFEATRDALLAVSGALDSTMGGRGVPINEPPFPPRRTVYGTIDRQNLDGVYRTFDFANPDSTSARRFVTTVPQQALFLMNSPFMLQQVRQLASSTGATAPADAERVRLLYGRLLGRVPDARELALGTAFVRRQEQVGSSLAQAVWGYGSGRVDAASGRVASYQALPHWTGTAWQFGPTLPHPQGHYLHWSASGGHAGVDPDHSPVLRWTAPRDGVFAVEGVLGHERGEGDGVRGRVVSSRAGTLGDWVAHGAKVPTPVARAELKAGDTLDFLVDCRTESSYDTFSWTPVVKENGGSAESWDAKAGFHGPLSGGLSPWEEYSQVLLLTNEFVFVD